MQLIERIISLAQLTFILALTVSCSPSNSQQIEKISNAQLSEMLPDPELQVLDVRTPEEVSYGRIAGAVHVDFYDPQFEAKVSELNKNKPVAVYCAAGARSATSAAKLAQLGFSRVYDLEGGLRQWQKDGFQVVNE